MVRELKNNFSKKTKAIIASQVNNICSNPDCRIHTCGPHSEEDKKNSNGQAAHIRAASPGGPRYEAQMTPSERSSAENAIWLCANCATMIDKDPAKYPVDLLQSWKIQAKSDSLAKLGKSEAEKYLPQPSGIVHALLPQISELPYDEARKKLIQAGWQPYLNHWSFANDPDICYGNGPFFWRKCFYEICNACPTGYANCNFLFNDSYGNRLMVSTVGEAFEDNMPTVDHFSLDNKSND